VHQILMAGDILKLLDIRKLTKESASGACAPEPEAGGILKVLDIRKLTKESTAGACSPEPDGWGHTEDAGHT
jgi:hypothetical protein